MILFLLLGWKAFKANALIRRVGRVRKRLKKIRATADQSVRQLELAKEHINIELRLVNQIKSGLPGIGAEE